MTIYKPAAHFQVHDWTTREEERREERQVPHKGGLFNPATRYQDCDNRIKSGEKRFAAGYILLSGITFIG